MIRLITIVLCLSVSISVPVKGDHTATLRLDDPLIQESPKKSNQSETADRAKEVVAEKPGADTNQHQKPIESPSAVESPASEQSASDSKSKPNSDLSLIGQTTEAQANAIARSATEIAIDDFGQQFRMAESADFMATVSFWQFLLGGFGAALLFWTLWETRRTANAAVKQAQQNRAWIVYKRTNSGGLIGDTYKVIFYVANMGQSPANKIVIKKAKYAVYGPVISDPNAAMSSDVIESTKGGALGPGVEFALNFYFSQADLREVIASDENNKVIIWINITYETLKITNAMTEHTFEVVPVISDATGDLVEMSICPIGPRNSAR